jgi:hypothetical protein
MHTNSVKATHFPGLWDRWEHDESFAEYEHPGAYEFTVNTQGQKRMVFVCPGCKGLTFIAIRPVVDGSEQSWEWDGNEEVPTLTPSIHHVGCWHGFLTNGEFKSC